MYILWRYREKQWELVGQYATREEANRIKRDYQARGEKVKITIDNE